jgi:hypothetical protein
MRGYCVITGPDTAGSLRDGLTVFPVGKGEAMKRDARSTHGIMTGLGLVQISGNRLAQTRERNCGGHWSR